MVDAEGAWVFAAMVLTVGVAAEVGNWVNKDPIEQGEREGLTVDERARLAQLQREVGLHP